MILQKIPAQVAVLLAAFIFAIPTQAQETVRAVLSDRSVNWKKPSERAQAVQRMKAIENKQLQKAQEIAKKQGKPLRENLPGLGVRELVGLDEDGELLYAETKNDNAAISTGANIVNQLPYSVDGSGLRVGVWDADSALVTHQEFNEGATSRINNMNGQPSDDHATHVAGIIAAFGVESRAKGMAYQATIDSYDWTSDNSEMALAGAYDLGQFDTHIYLSNHSYGYTYGWDNDGGWIWEGTGTDQDAYDPDYGQYSFLSDQMDGIAYNSPYYLIFWAAGNENTDGPSNGNTVTIGGQRVTYDSSIHPQNDGDYRNGFETIADEGIAKNLVAVGAANDAVTSGQRDPAKATKVGFSSTGPADDGRIKPDLMGNGSGLYSPVDSSDTSYRSSSGTSMASPNVCGTAALLVALYRDLFGSNAAMRSSTLKGLLIHTATDIGNPGPDYQFGWGLVDAGKAAELIQRQADSLGLESIIEDQLSTAQPLQNYTFSWDGASPIRATLCWTDPAGSSESTHDERTPDLVNDLNLKLIAPDGTEYFPFVMPFVGTWTVASMSENATTGINHVDNVEQVLVEAPAQAGAWQAEVTYLGSLEDGAQDYGLIISGSDTVGALAFSSSAYTVNEYSGSATITVERIGGKAGAVSVDYATADDTALAASDYTATSGTLNWADGEDGPKSFDVTIMNDSVSENDEETLSITLSNAVGTTISWFAAATLNIRDDEPLMRVIAPNGGEALSANVAYDITWSSSLIGDVRIELLKGGILYTTITDTTVNDGLYEWTVPLLAPTASDYRIRITSLSGGSESDESNETFAIDNRGAIVDIYTANMDSDPGWTLQGDWEYGVPKGLGEDPSSGHTGSNVIGYNLDGQYTSDLPETYATTAAIDCSDLINVKLSFYRWLGVEKGQWDDASIRVTNDGVRWEEMWGNPYGAHIADSSWQYQTFDISDTADGESTVYIRWVMGATDGAVTYCGWNIDDVVVSGLGNAENPAGEVAFSSAIFTVSEDGSSAIITVDRNGGTTGAISVDYSTADGTATAGADYAATSGTLIWADGDDTSKVFSVPLNDDSDREAYLETVQLTLSNTVGATIVAPNPATLNIQDDENNAPDVDAGEDQYTEWQEFTATPGLYYGTVSGAAGEGMNVTAPNPESQILVDVSSETENKIGGYTSEIYTGNIYDADGQISFTEHIDDEAKIWIDGVLILSDADWRTRASTANLDIEPGWHTIEIRIYNGVGGSGPQSTPGIGYDPTGGTAWQTLVDPGDGTFLTANQDIPGAEVDLNGTVSDLDSDPLTTLWTVVSGPGLVTFTDATVIDTLAQFDAFGTYVLRLTADDAREQTSDDIIITVGFAGVRLEIDEASISENGGSSNATVSRFFSSGDLLVNLSSDDISEATVPASVTILDGQTSASFTITAQDDADVDDANTVTITTSSAGNGDVAGTIDVTDDEVAALTLNVVADTINESDGSGSTTATVSRNSNTTSEMVVDLNSSDTTEVTVPSTVTIAAGQTTSLAFDIAAVDDSLVDGTQNVTLAASYAGHLDGTDTLDVTDDVPITLSLVLGSGGASVSGGGTKDPEASFEVTATPASEFQFVDWTVTSGSATIGPQINGRSVVSTSVDTTIQANFALITYAVTYNGNGSDGGTLPIDANSPHDTGSTVAVLGNTGGLSRTGYTFAGWNTASNGSGTSYIGGDTFTISANTTLFAEWIPDTYTVSYDGNGNTGGTPPADQIKTHDAPLALASNSGNFVKDGFAFAGWNTASDGSGSNYAEGAIFNTDANVTLYARWNIPPTVDSGDDQTIYLSQNSTWTPAELATAVWYDAETPATIIENNGAVSQWNDKSDNANHLVQASSIEQPTTGLQTIGGLNAMNFADDFMQTTSANSNIRAVFFISDNLEGSSANISVAPIFGETTANESYTFVRTNILDYSISIDGNNNTTGAASVFGNTLTAGGNIDLGLSVAEKESPLIWYAEYDSNVTMDYLGLLTSNMTFHLKGTIGEFVAFETVPTVDDRQKMEGYLAHKWSLEGNLPVDHPYKNIEPSTPVAIAALDATVTDPDGGPVTQLWTKEGGPSAAVVFDDDTAVDTNATFSEVGTYILRLTTDDGFHQTFDEVEITVGLPSLSGFTNWMSGYDVGAEAGFADDPDNDNLDNGIESYFGTHPGEFSVGLLPVAVDDGAGTFTFSHPLNDSPASDISASYRWSKDLSTFHGHAEEDLSGTTVSFEQGTASGGMVTVTATVTGTATDKIFIVVEVIQD